MTFFDILYLLFAAINEEEEEEEECDEDGEEDDPDHLQHQPGHDVASLAVLDAVQKKVATQTREQDDVTPPAVFKEARNWLSQLWKRDQETGRPVWQSGSVL